MKKDACEMAGGGAALAAVVLVADSMVITHENEYSVIRQFGKVVDVRSTPGVSLGGCPWQTVTKVPDTVLLYDLPLSDDHPGQKTMVADSFVLWRITDPPAVYPNPERPGGQRGGPAFHHRVQLDEEHHQFAHPGGRDQRPRRRAGGGYQGGRGRYPGPIRH